MATARPSSTIELRLEFSILTVFSNITEEKDWNEISPEAKAFIRKMLVVDPKQRISAEEALKDEWIGSNQKEGKLHQRNLDNLAKFQGSSKLKAAIM